jgi:Hydantoinase B/oxoprolinase
MEEHSHRRERAVTHAIDAIDLEVIKASLGGIVQEMQNSLFRTGFSTIVRESQDASCALMDESGEVVAQHVVLALHIGAFPACCAAVLEARSRAIAGASRTSVVCPALPMCASIPRSHGAHATVQASPSTHFVSFAQSQCRVRRGSTDKGRARTIRGLVRSRLSDRGVLRKSARELCISTIWSAMNFF